MCGQVKHKNKSDIIHYYHTGSPITYLIVDPQGKLSKFKLGFDVTQGHTPQLLVQGGCWKTAILEEGEFGLLGESVAPGFEYTDMEMAKPDFFRASFPNLWDELSPYIKQ
ncbi:cupin domain-containing protein [Hydrocoleum sp. CS-953]|uniref:cupin domain-containing protein n=1 Tax=Hydrocoleum sp. CS-953 TaxID=1671698 RepID=UPI001AEFD4EB|nr:cupin domain-containing protein [Hydrocoleum sp. CS-953]